MLSPEECRLAICDWLIEQEFSTTQIRNLLHIRIATIIERRRSLGLASVRARRSRRKALAVIADYEAKLPWNTIIRKHRIGRATLQKILKEFEVPKRETRYFEPKALPNDDLFSALMKGLSFQ